MVTKASEEMKNKNKEAPARMLNVSTMT